MTTPTTPTSPQDQLTALEMEISAAEQHLATTEGSLTDLAARIEAGENIGPEVIPDCRRLIDHGRLVLSGLRARRGKLAAAARLERLHALRAEIEAEVAADGSSLTTLPALITAAEESLVAVFTAAEDYRAKVNSWRVAMTSELVPPYAGHHPEPPPGHGGLGHSSSNGIAVGSLRIPYGYDPMAILQTITHNVEVRTERKRDHRHELRTIRTAPPMDPNLRFFIEAGTVSVFAPDRVPQSLLDRPHAREITADEAIAVWHQRGIPEAHSREAMHATPRKEVVA
jgi:hypothetical protein